MDGNLSRLVGQGVSFRVGCTPAASTRLGDTRDKNASKTVETHKKKEKFRSFDYSDIPIKECTSTILIRLAGRLAVAWWRGSTCATKNNDARCGVSVVFRPTKDSSQHIQHTQHIKGKNIEIQISKIHKNYKLQKRSQKKT